MSIIDVVMILKIMIRQMIMMTVTDDDADEMGLCFSGSLLFLCSLQNGLLSGVQTRLGVVDLAGHLSQISHWRNYLLQKIMYLSLSV
jgi:hypothetical protein